MAATTQLNIYVEVDKLVHLVQNQTTNEVARYASIGNKREIYLTLLF